VTSINDYQFQTQAADQRSELAAASGCTAADELNSLKPNGNYTYQLF
jgi:hypothetical protein